MPRTVGWEVTLALDILNILNGVKSVTLSGDLGNRGPIVLQTVPPTTSSDTEHVSNQAEVVETPLRITSLVKDSDATHHQRSAEILQMTTSIIA